MLRDSLMGSGAVPWRCCYVLAIAGVVGWTLLPSRGLAQRLDLTRVGDTWRYYRGFSDPPSNWITLGFDDASWPEGRTGIGYGDGDDITVLSDMQGGYLTVYARRTFTLSDPAGVRRLFLKASYDDGFVGYVNGFEVARRGLGAPGEAVHHDTPSRTHEAGEMEEIDLAPAIPHLLAGTNILAIEIHNDLLDGDDLSFVPVLRAYGREVAVRRGPYLQMMTETSVLVVWQTDPAGSRSAVEYGPTTALGSVVETTEALATHEVELTGLSPGREYYYRVVTDGVALSPVHRFRTDAGPGAHRVRIAAFGDTEELSEGLLGAVRQVELMRPDIGIITGDIIPRGDADAYLFDPWVNVLPGCVFYPTLGNHDLEDNTLSYLQAFYLPSESSKTEEYYAVDRGDVHIVSLDTMGDYAPGSTQHRWLRSDLSANSRPWTIVVLHLPPYSTSSVHGSDLGIREALVPVFDEFRVDLVLAGHNHNYERTYPLRGGTRVDHYQEPDYIDPQGTIYVVTGAAGGVIYPRDPVADWSLSARFEAVNHVCQIDIEGDQLLLKAIGADGSTIDTAQVRKSDIQPPTISAIRVPDLRATLARIDWATDEPAGSEIEYGIHGEETAWVYDGLMVTAHSLVITGLDPETLYQARVRSVDAAGNAAISEPMVFETMRLFVRGDANLNGRITIGDAIRILVLLFAEAGPGPCPDAADADDSGTVAIADALLVLHYIFGKVPPLRGPFPEPGDDPTGDRIGCRGM